MNGETGSAGTTHARTERASKTDILSSSPLVTIRSPSSENEIELTQAALFLKRLAIWSRVIVESSTRRVAIGSGILDGFNMVAAWTVVLFCSPVRENGWRRRKNIERVPLNRRQGKARCPHQQRCNKRNAQKKITLYIFFSIVFLLKAQRTLSLTDEELNSILCYNTQYLVEGRVAKEPFEMIEYFDLEHIWIRNDRIAPKRQVSTE